MPTTGFGILLSGAGSHLNQRKWPDGLQAGMEPHQRCAEVYLTHKSVTRANFKKTADTCWDRRTWQRYNPVKHGGTLLQVFVSVFARAQSMKNLCVFVSVCVCMGCRFMRWQLSSSKPERRLLISAGGHWGIWQQSRRFHNCLITVSPLEQITSVGSPFVLHCWSSFRPKLRATMQRRWLIKREKKEETQHKLVEIL